MSNLFIETMLFDVFRAQGLRNPAKAARKAAEGFDLERRNQTIYELRATVSAKDLAARYSMTVQQVHKIIRDQMLLMRECA